MALSHVGQLGQRFQNLSSSLPAVNDDPKRAISDLICLALDDEHNNRNLDDDDHHHHRRTRRRRSPARGSRPRSSSRMTTPAAARSRPSSSAARSEASSSACVSNMTDLHNRTPTPPPPFLAASPLRPFLHQESSSAPPLSSQHKKPTTASSPLIDAVRELHGGVHLDSFQYYERARRDELLFPPMVLTTSATTPVTSLVDINKNQNNLLSPRRIATTDGRRVAVPVGSSARINADNTASAVIDTGLQSLLPALDQNPVSTARAVDFATGSSASSGQRCGHWPKLPDPKPIFTKIVPPRGLIVSEKSLRDKYARSKNADRSLLQLPKSIEDAGRRAFLLGKEALKHEAAEQEAQAEEMARKNAAKRRRAERLQREVRMKLALGKM